MYQAPHCAQEHMGMAKVWHALGNTKKAQAETDQLLVRDYLERKSLVTKGSD
jgi:hypothetical protein